MISPLPIPIPGMNAAKPLIENGALIRVDAADIRDVVIYETPDGDGYRRIRITWLDQLSNERGKTFYGSDAAKLHADLATLRAHGSEERVAAYVLGVIRGATA